MLSITSIIAISAGGALVLLAFIAGMIIVSKHNLKTKNRPLEQITNEPFFVNDSHKKEKWYVSDGVFEKKWLEGQDFDFPVKTFDYYENFSESFLNSKLVRTKIFISQFMDMKTVNKTIERLKINLTCLENIWWKKYKLLFGNAKKEISNVSKAPEYFFYKYYFKFLTGLRKIMIDNLVNYIIPNTIYIEMKSVHFRLFKIAAVDDPQKNIIYAFRNVQVEADKLSNILHKQYVAELEEKGRDFTIDYKNNGSEMLNVLNPLVYIDKVYYRDKLNRTYKTLKISKNKNMDEATMEIEKKIKDSEILKLQVAKKAIEAMKG